MPQPVSIIRKKLIYADGRVNIGDKNIGQSYVIDEMILEGQPAIL